MAVSSRRVGEQCSGAELCWAVRECSPLKGKPCIWMAQAHAEKLSLCEQLERVADSLPDRIDRLLCLQIANRLLPVMRESHRHEEQVLFPAFDRAARKPGRVMVTQLTSDHIFDECAAEEITEAFLHIGHGGEVANPEALGFMLRAFFGTVRRHIAYEQEYLFPALDRGG
ncbi:hemerythrin domain-containing protein [Mesorhizobium sp. ASY16-5R]|uniref:hemerythrin domain-containing protein n=1 Tax=Mesorhizobium sp. ASY16-5R TaxID=3445772 RepID=UPI003FA00BBB